jgi:hypothetical protein
MVQLGIFRFVLGLGMGGGVDHRRRARWPRPGRPSTAARPWAHAVELGHRRDDRGGCGGPRPAAFGWRAVFFVGVLPALLVFWIRRDVPESPIWLSQERAARPVSLAALWAPSCAGTPCWPRS